MISKTSLQIIKALLELSFLSKGETLGVGVIAQRIKARENYLGKVLQRLAKEGIVISQKGLNGGFRLGRPAEDIKLYDIVDFLEDIKRWEGCFMGKATCSKESACCVHKKWGAVSSAYIGFLKETSILDLNDR